MHSSQHHLQLVSQPNVYNTVPGPARFAPISYYTFLKHTSKSCFWVSKEPPLMCRYALATKIYMLSSYTYVHYIINYIYCLKPPYNGLHSSVKLIVNMAVLADYMQTLEASNWLLVGTLAAVSVRMTI